MGSFLSQVQTLVEGNWRVLQRLSHERLWDMLQLEGEFFGQSSHGEDCKKPWNGGWDGGEDWSSQWGSKGGSSSHKSNGSRPSAERSGRDKSLSRATDSWPMWGILWMWPNSASSGRDDLLLLRELNKGRGSLNLGLQAEAKRMRFCNYFAISDYMINHILKYETPIVKCPIQIHCENNKNNNNIILPPIFFFLYQHMVFL